MYLVTLVFYKFFHSVNNKEMLIFVVMSYISCVKPPIAVDCLRGGILVF